MTGTAYFVAVIVLLGMYLVWRYPDLRARAVNLIEALGPLRRIRYESSRELNTEGAVTKIAESVRFERIDDLVEFSRYLAVVVPPDLFEIWDTNMDKVASAVAKKVNVRGTKYAQRHRAKWRTIAPNELHYFISVGNFQVAASFVKSRSSATAEVFDSDGRAEFQAETYGMIGRTRVYGIDPLQWEDDRTEHAPSAVAIRVVHAERDVCEMQLPSSEDPVTIGRDRRCDLVIPDKPELGGVSSRHMTVERVSGGVKVIDSSTNGTYRSDGHRLTIGRPTIMAPDEYLFLGHPRSGVLLHFDVHS